MDAFVPRITYGKLVKRPDAPSAPEASEQGQSATTSEGAVGSDAVDDVRKAQVAQAFALVKRDLVRLLGILASENRAVQDRVRECGGIPVVMNLCVVDDYNPCESRPFPLASVCAPLRHSAIAEWNSYRLTPQRIRMLTRVVL